ncbi:epoxyqueuosine reductase QueH [Dehalobacter sp. DCM]|uniref:epoxyqueuosine reductase QueH n=1 Tax=Dehalobacter sp. DCM TaxID=2907827 RepID=UPI00308168ED|nr:epoxyqueuosine reductase QueH [Dehalobacter sp. DCM]
MTKEKILLHACCAPCSGYVLEQLSLDYEPVIFYSNPNIHPESEYFLRRDELRQFAASKSIAFVEDQYDTAEWVACTRGLENEPERGSRCTRCFALRLQKTASYARQNDFKSFTTTLTVSPHKNSSVILEIGQWIAAKNEILFLSRDFKKKDGYKKATEIARIEKFYRQQYCGCVYSLSVTPKTGKT